MIDQDLEVSETAIEGPRLPWMKFWVADLLTSSFVLSLSEVDFARYLRLLFRAWESDTPCFLPNNVVILARFAGASSLKSFRKTWEIIGGHFTVTLDGKYVFNSKERLTFQKQLGLIENSIRNGKKNSQVFNNQQTCINSGIPTTPPTGVPAGIPAGIPALARGLQVFRSLQDKEQELPPPPAAPAPRDKESREREIIDRAFEFYIFTFGKNPKKYQLTDARRQKAGLRFRERLKANDGDEGLVEKEFGKCIENLAASDYHRTNGYIDWIEQIFRSQEEFEKRLNWQNHSGGNGNGNKHGKNSTAAAVANLQTALRESGFEVCADTSSLFPAGPGFGQGVGPGRVESVGAAPGGIQPRTINASIQSRRV